MDVLVCIKRVPGTGSSIELTADGRAVDTRHLGFTIGPHEECAIEEAVSIVGSVGGTVTVLTVGLAEAEEQLRYALSMGADAAVRVSADVEEPDPQATAAAIVAGVRALDSAFGLILFGNESADAGNYQVGTRVAWELGLPVVGGVKGIELGDGVVRFRRPVPDGVEVYEAAFPAAAAVMEGLNLPRYPSMRGRLRSAKAAIQVIDVEVPAGGLRSFRFHHPVEASGESVVLGTGPDAAPAVVDVLEKLL